MHISRALSVWLALAGIQTVIAATTSVVAPTAMSESAAPFMSTNDFTTVDAWQDEEPLDPIDAADVEAVQACRGQLEQVAEAIRAYRAASGDSYPVWLSALVPHHLPEASTLLCPADGEGGDALAAKSQDPNLPVSYLYELSPSEYEARRGQIRQYGGIVPIVRCLHHLHVPLSAVIPTEIRDGEATLSITEDLRVDMGIPEWKADTVIIARVYGDMLADVSNADAVSLERYPFGVMKLLDAEQLRGIRDAIKGAAGQEPYAQMGAYHKLAGAYRARINRPADAVTSYQRASELLPGNAEVFFALGVLLGQQGDDDQSIAAFEEGLRLQPDTVDVALTLARHYAREGADDDLRRVYDTLRSHYRRESFVHKYAMGTVAFLVDDLQESRAAFEAVLSDLPPTMSASHGIPRYAIRRLASLYERQGDVSGAAVLLTALDEGMTLIGEVVPDIVGESTSGGGVSLSEYEGQVVAVAFWRSDNPASRAQLRHLDALRSEVGGGFVIVAVNVAPPENVGRERLYATANIPGPAIFGANSSVRAYAVTSAPTAVLVDRQGVARHRHVGHAFEDERDIERHVRALIDEN